MKIHPDAILWLRYASSLVGILVIGFLVYSGKADMSILIAFLTGALFPTGHATEAVVKK